MLVALAARAAGAAGQQGQDTLSWALDQGGAFIAAAAFAYGWFRAERRADAERTARNDLADQFMVKVIPALEASTAAGREFIAAGRELNWRQSQYGRSAGPDQQGGG